MQDAPSFCELMVRHAENTRALTELLCAESAPVEAMDEERDTRRRKLREAGQRARALFLDRSEMVPVAEGRGAPGVARRAGGVAGSMECRGRTTSISPRSKRGDSPGLTGCGPGPRKREGWAGVQWIVCERDRDGQRVCM